MSNPLRTPEDYELFLYTIMENFSSVHRSTVTLVRRGASLARVAGTLFFDFDYRIIVRERLLFHTQPALIDWYGYEFWKGNNKLFWYDSQSHPNDPTLQSSHPHHKHIPPDIKHHRIPAPQMSFMKPNLPVLIKEIEELINNITKRQDEDA